MARVQPEAEADSLIMKRFLNLDSLGGRQCREYLVEEADKMVQRYAPEYYREIEPPLIDRMIVGSKNDTLSAGKMRSDHEGRAYYMVTYPHDPDYEYMHAGFIFGQTTVWPFGLREGLAGDWSVSVNPGCTMIRSIYCIINGWRRVSHVQKK